MSAATTAFVHGFDATCCKDPRQVGGKAHGLAAMAEAELPVAPGFAVSAAAFREFLSQGTLRDGITEALADVSTDQPDTLTTAAQRISALLADAPLPPAVAAEVRTAYAALCEETGLAEVPVAVRSSATAEDSGADSFAGEFATWVDVSGVDEVLRHVHLCYAHVFTAGVLSYALARGIDPAGLEMAVVVQKTIRARAAGVMFTVDPISGDRSRIVVESSWGLGLSVVAGEVTPDRYTVNKVRLAITDRTLGDKRTEYRYGDAAVPVPPQRRDQLCLSDREVLELAALGKRLEKLHDSPQDIEFAVDEDLPDDANIVLLQCRPETVWSGAERKPGFDSGAGLMSWITGSITGGAATTGQVARGHE